MGTAVYDRCQQSQMDVSEAQDVANRWRRVDGSTEVLDFADELQALCSEMAPCVIDAVPRELPARDKARFEAMVGDIRSQLRSIMKENTREARELQRNKPRYEKELTGIMKKLHVLKRAWDTAEAPDPAKPEPDLLGMCAGQPHYTEEQLAQKREKAEPAKKAQYRTCLCRKCMAE